MSIKLRNRKTAEAQLGQFVEDISLPPKLISAIVDGEVSARTHHLLSRESLLTPRFAYAGERCICPLPRAAAHQD